MATLTIEIPNGSMPTLLHSFDRVDGETGTPILGTEDDVVEFILTLLQHKSDDYEINQAARQKQAALSKEKWPRPVKTAVRKGR